MPNRQDTTPHHCNYRMRRFYIHVSEENWRGKKVQRYRQIGWLCMRCEHTQIDDPHGLMA